MPDKLIEDVHQGIIDLLESFEFAELTRSELIGQLLTLLAEQRTMGAERYRRIILKLYCEKPPVGEPCNHACDDFDECLDCLIDRLDQWSDEEQYRATLAGKP